MTSSPRFADLLGLLEGLGFDGRRVEDGRRICEHRPTDTLIVLADRPAAEAVREQILVGVRLQLEGSGLLMRDQFDEAVCHVGRAEAANGARRAQAKRKMVRDDPA